MCCILGLSSVFKATPLEIPESYLLVKNDHWRLVRRLATSTFVTAIVRTRLAG
jgi:hypothetical protein